MIKNIAKKAGGISLGSAMLLLSLMPATSAFAASVPAVVSVKLSSEQGTVAVGNTVSFTATATQSGSATPMYQFWYEGVHGNWHGTSWSSHNTFSLPALQQGSYEVVVFAKDKGQATSVNSEGTNTNQFVNVDSSATLTAPSLTNVAPGTTLNFTASSKNLTNPVYQLWIQKPDGTWYASGAYQSSPNFSITASTAGDYHAVLYAKDLNAPQTAQFSEYSKATFDAFGQAAAVKLSAASSSLVADGKATDTITATVVDANGNPVADFNGTVTIASSGSGVTFAAGTGQASDFTFSGTSGTLTLSQGKGTFVVDAGTVAGLSDTFTTSDLTPTAGSPISGVVTGTATLKTIPQVATKILVTPTTSRVAVNQSSADTVQAEVVDQLGNPMLSGTYPLTFTVSGPGTVNGGTSATTTFSGNGTTSPTVASATVDSITGDSGTIYVDVSSPNLPTTYTAIQAVVAGNPANLQLTDKTPSFAQGSSGTAVTAVVTDANGTPVVDNNGTVNVTVTHNGQTATNILVNGTALTSSAPSVSVPLTTVNNASEATLTISNTGTSADAGTYVVTVTSPSGATYALNSASVTVTETAAAPSKLVVSSTAQEVPESNAATVVKAQLEDQYGNPVALSGVPVTFYYSATGGSGTATINGTSGATTATSGVTVETNSNGTAAATVTMQPYVGEQFTVTGMIPSTYTAVSGLATTSGSTTVTVTSTVPTTAAITLTDATSGSVDYLSPSYAQAGNTVDGTVTFKDQYGNPVGVSSATVTVSGGLTLTTGTVTGGTLAAGSTTGTYVFTATSGTTSTFDFVATAGKEGTATVTATDTAVSPAASGSASISVVPGSYSTMALFENGTAVTNPVTVAANTPVALTVTPVDAGGNPVVAPSTITVDLTANSSGTTAITTGAFRLSPTGADVEQVQVPAGSTGVTVYYVNGTSGSYTLGDAVSYIKTFTVAPTSTTFTYSSTTPTVTLTYTAVDQYGYSVDNATVDVATNVTTTGKAGAGDTEVTGSVSGDGIIITSSSGTFTLTYSNTTADGDSDLTDIVTTTVTYQGSSTSATTDISY